MPISAMDGYPASHWSDVRKIIDQAIVAAGFEPKLISRADDVSLIHKTIVRNLYDSPIVVCDVSGKNASVMFELGLRLAFDKPTIILKDDETAYSFDASLVELIGYPKDLRFAQIVTFQSELAQKIGSTHANATGDPSYSAFLKHFGAFIVAKLDNTEVPAQESIVAELARLSDSVGELVSSLRRMPLVEDKYTHPFIRRASPVEATSTDPSEGRDLPLETQFADGRARARLYMAGSQQEADEIAVALDHCGAKATHVSKYEEQYGIMALVTADANVEQLNKAVALARQVRQ
jgi:hypothetical protein